VFCYSGDQASPRTASGGTLETGSSYPTINNLAQRLNPLKRGSSAIAPSHSQNIGEPGPNVWVLVMVSFFKLIVRPFPVSLVRLVFVDALTSVVSILQAAATGSSPFTECVLSLQRLEVPIICPTRMSSDPVVFHNNVVHR
jgi:hypothetical protein